MDSIFDQSQLNEINKICRGSRAVDSSTGWIYLNRIWFLPDQRKKFAPFLNTFFDSALSIVSHPLLLVPEGITSSFGTTPFISVYAYEKSLFMLFWKEFGDVLTITPFIFPQPNEIRLPKEYDLVVVQDVVGDGSIIYKIANDIKRYGNNWKIRLFIAIVRLDEKEQELQKVLEKISSDQENKVDFRFMLQSSLLR